MHYSSLNACVEDLEAHGHLIRIQHEVDPDLEVAAIQRDLYKRQGPAVLFENLKGSNFPALANLYGSMERCRFIFRKSIGSVSRVVQAKADPQRFARRPWTLLDLGWTAVHALPRKVRNAPVMECEARLEDLPKIKSWPMDGGAFITLPQVFSRDPLAPKSLLKSNLGMYRVQLDGNQYLPGQEAGLHYQLHRGIGVHHTSAMARGEPLKVSIFVGGPPSHTFAAVMPLPEGISELTFAGMLGQRRFRFAEWQGHTISADADFCIVGTIEGNQTKPEGPFGDHLGYYSLEHPFPVLKVEKVFHRKDAIWPFTVVGRPPQEDTSFGHLIHELTAPAVPSELPGVHAVHAVDAAGVHPLLLAIGSERYLPYIPEEQRQPQELLTIANSILGFGQCSLAKYLWIVAKEDCLDLKVDAEMDFLQFCLERLDFSRDLHFQTKTTIDTLDYSGEGLNQGSKLVLAAVGKAKRILSTSPPDWSGEGLFKTCSLVAPGIVAVSGPEFTSHKQAILEMKELQSALQQLNLEGLPLWVVTDDAEFTAADHQNFLWETFTRSNPSHDVYGNQSSIQYKHWGCEPPLIIDARTKPHHAPPLVEPKDLRQRVERVYANCEELAAIMSE